MGSIKHPSEFNKPKPAVRPPTPKEEFITHIYNPDISKPEYDSVAVVDALDMAAPPHKAATAFCSSSDASLDLITDPNFQFLEDRAELLHPFTTLKRKGTIETFWKEGTTLAQAYADLYDIRTKMNEMIPIENIITKDGIHFVKGMPYENITIEEGQEDEHEYLKLFADNNPANEHEARAHYIGLIGLLRKTAFQNPIEIKQSFENTITTTGQPLNKMQLQMLMSYVSYALLTVFPDFKGVE